MTIKGKPDINEFLDGGAVDVANKTDPKRQKPEKKSEKIAPKQNTRVHREQKIFRLPLDLIEVLRDQAYERSKKSGIRITETELVEQALRVFFDM
jgi:hypothetical protein